MPHVLEDDIGYLLARTHRSMRHALIARLEPLGITYPQFQVLNALCEQDGISQTVIAQKVNMNPSVLARILDRMERAGLIERVEDPEDLRAKRVMVTARGCALQAEFAPQRDAVLMQAITGMADEEVRGLKQRLNTIYDNVQPLVGEGQPTQKGETRG